MRGLTAPSHVTESVCGIHNVIANTRAAHMMAGLAVLMAAVWFRPTGAADGTIALFEKFCGGGESNEREALHAVLVRLLSPLEQGLFVKNKSLLSFKTVA